MPQREETCAGQFGNLPYYRARLKAIGVRGKGGISPNEPESGLKGAVDRELGGKYKRTFLCFLIFDIVAEKLFL